MKFVFYDEMVYIYLFMRWYQKNDELLIFKKSIVSSNTIVITSSVEICTKIQSKKFRYPEHLLNTSRTRREHATRFFCKISTITFFGMNIGQSVIRRHLPDVFEHIFEHVNTSSNKTRKITVIQTGNMGRIRINWNIH